MPPLVSLAFSLGFWTALGVGLLMWASATVVRGDDAIDDATITAAVMGLVAVTVEAGYVLFRGGWIPLATHLGSVCLGLIVFTVGLGLIGLIRLGLEHLSAVRRPLSELG